MTPSFWPLYHIPALTGLSIKRTLGLILALSGRNTLKERNKYYFYIFSKLERIYSLSINLTVSLGFHLLFQMLDETLKIALNELKPSS